MKRSLRNISKRKWILLISCFVCLILAAGLHTCSSILKNQLPHEQVANHWDEEGTTAQISVFLSETEKYNMKQDVEQTEYRMQSWYHQLLQELQNASITLEEGTPKTARLLVYGYSATGKVTMSSSLGKVDAKAYGVGGDFFQFHPLKLVAGSYFTESDLMQDRVLLDTETAWKLFGSNDIVGMFVTIDHVPHMVVGVYEREEGYLNDAAGNDVGCVYVSHDTLSKYGDYHGLESIEYLIPNPVTGFAKDLIVKQCNNMDVAIVEHQNRFDFLPLISVLKQFGTRSMGLSGITFPYWENMARGYEDILSGLLFAECIVLGYVILVVIAMIWHWWLHRTFRASHMMSLLKDKWYAFGVYRYKRKQQRKGEK